MKLKIMFLAQKPNLNIIKVIFIFLMLLLAPATSFAQEENKELIDKLFETAEFNAEEGNYDAAISDYVKIIELAPQDKDAYYGRGYTYLLKLEYDKAIADFTKALEIKPDDFYIFYARGKAYFKKGDYENSIADHSRELDLQSNRDLGLLGRGNAYQKLKQFDDAIADYNAAIRIAEKPALYLARGTAFEAKGDNASAISDLRYYLERVPDDFVVREKTLKLGVKESELPPMIIADYKNMPASIKEPMLRAIEKIGEGDFNEAIADLSKLIKNSPKTIEAYFYRGYAYEMQASLLNASKINADYTKAVTLNPQFAEAYIRRAYSAFYNGRDKEASADIKRAIVLNPKSAKAFYYRGIFSRQEPKTLADFAHALKLNSNYAEVYLSRGEIFLGKKKLVQAIADFSAVMKINANDLRAYEGRAKAFCEQGRKDLAESDERKLIELGGELNDPCQ